MMIRIVVIFIVVEETWTVYCGIPAMADRDRRLFAGQAGSNDQILSTSMQIISSGDYLEKDNQQFRPQNFKSVIDPCIFCMLLSSRFLIFFFK